MKRSFYGRLLQHLQTLKCPQPSSKITSHQNLFSARNGKRQIEANDSDDDDDDVDDDDDDDSGGSNSDGLNFSNMFVPCSFHFIEFGACWLHFASDAS